MRGDKSVLAPGEYEEITLKQAKNQLSTVKPLIPPSLNK